MFEGMSDDEEDFQSVSLLRRCAGCAAGEA